MERPIFDVCQHLNEMGYSERYAGKVKPSWKNWVQNLLELIPSDKRDNLCTKKVYFQLASPEALALELRDTKDKFVRLLHEDPATYKKLAIEFAPEVFKNNSNLLELDTAPRVGLRRGTIWNPLLVEDIAKCKERTIVVLVRLFNPREGGNSHINAVLINMTDEEVERFEPHGSMIQTVWLRHEPIDAWFATEFMDRSVFAGFTYLPPIEICPGRGPQIIAGERNVGRSGFCIAWSFMYFHMRLVNPYILPGDLIHHLLSRTPEDLHDCIVRYAAFLSYNFGWTFF